MTRNFALAFLLIASIIASVLSWSFDEELKGLWSIEKLVYQGTEEPQVITLTANLTVDGTTIRGIVLDSILDEKLFLEISKESDLVGGFKLSQGESGDIDTDVSTLEFPLNFKSTDLGIHISNTQNQDESNVDFVVINKNSWILTKVAKDGKTEKWVAKRTDIPQPSFFAKYGPMILMVGFFLLSNIFKQRMAPQVPAQATTAEAKNK